MTISPNPRPKAVRDTYMRGVGRRNGAPRIYLDGHAAVRTMFSPGDKIRCDVDGDQVVITKCANGSRTVSRRVKIRDGVEVVTPVIDINGPELREVFEGMLNLRIIVLEDRVCLVPLASEVKAVERRARLMDKTRRGEPLLIGSSAHGGGILSSAIHQGLTNAGIDSDLSFANEIREDLLMQAAQHNPAWNHGENGTSAICMPMQELAADESLLEMLGTLELLEIGIPCSGASKAGKAQRGSGTMESHEHVGYLVHAALRIIDACQPAVVLIENVPDYAHTGSADIMRGHFKAMGYDVHEAVLVGTDFGALEKRTRWSLVAVPRGMPFDFKEISPPMDVIRRVGEILDPSIGLDDPRWRKTGYLDEKSVRDALKGSGFSQQRITAESESIPVLRAKYWKGGSTDPRLTHPEDPELSRLLTAEEGAAAKGINPVFIKGLSNTTATELLGQSIIYPQFVAVGALIGDAIMQAAVQYWDERNASDDVIEGEVQTMKISA